VALGDRATAVGLLLAAAAPDRSARQYREALCAVALAAADAVAGRAGAGAALPSPPLLLAQACKVAAANAAASGDGLVGAPLLLAAGQPGEAAACLADAGLWRLAVTLACTAVPPGRERAAALDRFAAHLQEREAAGCGWGGAGVRAATGALVAAASGLRAAGAPDAAACLLAAASAAGLGDAESGPDGLARAAGAGAERAKHAAGVVGGL